MEEFGHTANDLDSGLIDEIVCKVKSEGLFDQFRRECLADVDTKPAYQNLQHRVESAVSLFLNDQTWSPQLNKNQLREKLRKLITEKRFFEAGIERIIDQVVIPKLNTNFVPKIEDVAYKFLGKEKPSLNIKMELEIDADLLPIYELEQVSPESEKSHSNETEFNVYETSLKYDMHEENDGKNEDLESPAFEPIEPLSEKKFTSNSTELMDNDDMDISDGDEGEQINGFNNSNADEVKSNLSSISGLTSNDSNSSSFDNFKGKVESDMADANVDNIDAPNIPQAKSIQSSENHVAPEITIGCAERLPLSENIISNNISFNQDSILSQDQLSQVSSSSRLSIVTNNNTNTQVGDVESNVAIDDISLPQHATQSVRQSVCPYGISEEAQMQKFNESSSSSNSLVIETDNMDVQSCPSEKRVLVTSFDINREEIKFQGTERKCYEICNKNDNGKRYDEDNSCNNKTETAFDSQQQANTNQDSNEDNQEDIQPSSNQSYNDEDITILRRQKDKCRHKSRSHDDGRKNSTEDIDGKSNKHRHSSKRDADNDKRDKKNSAQLNDTPHSSLNKKKTSKTDKSSNKQKDRPESHRSSCHKDKTTSRQRSRSKDSNDGFAHPNVQNSYNCNENNIVTTANSANEGDHVTTSSTSEGTTNATDPEQSTYMLDTVPSIEIQQFKSSNQYAEESIISSSPVVIDQILTGNDLDLKSFIGENRDDPVVSSIEQSLETKERKPKVADNMEDARRLMKVRKQIELKNQKQLEKATVLAKQYIRSNASNVRDDTKGGIELEFVCVENKKGRNMSGPIISSPINYINGKKLPTSTLTSTLIAATCPAKKTKFEDDKDLIGFNASEIEYAKECHHFISINTTFGKYSTKTMSTFDQRLVNDKQNHIHENNKDFDEVELTKSCNRKRKVDTNNTPADSKSSTVRDDDVLFFISKTPRECNYKSDATRIDDQISSKSTIEKQRQKTRYSNDDLFKPRPLVGGITRRRRGFNCNE